MENKPQNNQYTTGKEEKESVGTKLDLGSGALPDKLDTTPKKEKPLVRIKTLLIELSALQECSYNVNNYSPEVFLAGAGNSQLGSSITRPAIPAYVSLPDDAEQRIAELMDVLINERVVAIVMKLEDLGVTIEDDLVSFAQVPEL